jgi:hypothetical protein
MSPRAPALRVVLAAMLAAGCSSSSPTVAPEDAPRPAIDDAVAIDGATGPIDAREGVPPITGLGAHALKFNRLTDSMPDLGDLTTIATPTMATAASGSTIIVSIGRGALGAFALSTATPVDNQGNTAYPQLGATEKYTRWPSGTALYALTSGRGGANHTITAATPKGDEVTMAAVEALGRTKVQDFQWNEVLDGAHRSKSVTTTGPALLVAFWWGDGFVDDGYTATPNNGFAVIDAVLEGGSLVQCAVAVKSVTAAGTYDVTWTATPDQGAQLWLVAVQ